MGRKTQITKEQMLKAAYEILKEKGYSSVNIKSIAEKAGCSTQPISWQFGNMQGLRRELFAYANDIVFGEYGKKVSNKNALELFYESGKRYISNATSIPNVFRFLCVDDPGNLVKGKNNIADFLGSDFIKNALVEEFQMPPADANKAVADIVIYTHGLAVILMWEAVSIKKKEAFGMIYDQATIVFGRYGIDIKKYVEK